MLRNFYMDNDYRKQWDKTVFEYNQLQAYESKGVEVGRTQSCGPAVLADGRLADLIRRVSTFGMMLMKLDFHQESTRHSETVDAITKYLRMGTYNEWNEEKKLDFLTKELKWKRPLVPPIIEVR
ncbi:hypothetical protein AHAS_Ahas11G0171000 [Arachis hypogaea]